MSNASSPSTAPVSRPAASTPTDVRRLPNGMALLMRPNREAPVVTVDVWCGVGAADEPVEINGISHFLEHMMFKGTENFALGEIEREIESVGGVSNAGTSWDFTHYYLTLPSENADRGLEMLAEMVTRSTLDAGEMEKERLVILEEWRRKHDSPGSVLYEDLFEELFETGPYRRTVLGTEETIKTMSRDAMMDYYRRHYAPERMALIVTGDFDPDKMERRAAELFEGTERPFDPILKELEPTRPATNRRRHRARPTGGEAYFALARALEAPESPEQMIALDIAQSILGQGRASILFQSIKEKQGLASTIGCSYWTQRLASPFAITATCDPEKIDALRTAIVNELDRFASAPIDPDQFRRAKRMIASSHLFSFETTGSTSSQTGYYYTLTGGVDFLDTYLERLEAATPEAVSDAFAKLVDGETWVEAAVGPGLGEDGDEAGDTK